jgi:hypothetical protein
MKTLLLMVLKGLAALAGLLRHKTRKEKRQSERDRLEKEIAQVTERLAAKGDQILKAMATRKSRADLDLDRLRLFNEKELLQRQLDNLR